MRPFALLWMLAGVLLAVGAYKLALWPGFALKHIDVTGLSVVPRDAVIRRAALDPAKNLWLQDMRAAVVRVEAIPWVLTAEVHRTLPASVRIDVVERRAAGCAVAQDGSHFTIDADARVLEDACARMPQPIFRVAEVGVAPAPGVFVHSAQLRRLQEDARALDVLEPEGFLSYELDRFGQLEAVAPSGVRVKFGGDADLPKKIRLLDSIIKTTPGRRGDLRAIDLRAPASPVLEYK